MIMMDTEIRKLEPAQIRELTKLLDFSDGWKKLMSIIPKDDFQGYKFSGEHFGLLEHASQKHNKECAEIFFNEWSTMGRKRPTVETLLDLLVKVELYRAADYIAIEILKLNEGPRRPPAGPAAKIDLPSLLLERRVEIVESTSSIAGDVYMDHSFVNKMGNLDESNSRGHISEEEPYQIPTFLDGMNFSSLSLESMDKTSTERKYSTTSESEIIYDTNSEISETSVDNFSDGLPRCLQEMSLISASANESLQTDSKNESPNILDPTTS